LSMIMSIAATTKPRMTMVSGIAMRITMVPKVSGFSAMLPAPAEPILDWAIPVPRAPSPKAIPAPIGIPQLKSAIL